MFLSCFNHILPSLASLGSHAFGRPIIFNLTFLDLKVNILKTPFFPPSLSLSACLSSTIESSAKRGFKAPWLQEEMRKRERADLKKVEKKKKAIAQTALVV